MQINFRFSPERVTLVLGIIALSIFISSMLIGLIAYFVPIESDFLTAFFGIFNLDAEQTIINYYSTFILLLVAVLTLIIARIKHFRAEVHIARWYLLSIIFILLSIDENVSIHEMLNLLGTEQAAGAIETRHTWVLLASPVVIGFLFVYRPVFLNLPPKSRTSILFGLAAFISGAVGGEIIGGILLLETDWYSSLMRLVAYTEELLEIIGVIFVVYALLTYLRLSVVFPVPITLR